MNINLFGFLLLVLFLKNLILLALGIQKKQAPPWRFQGGSLRSPSSIFPGLTSESNVQMSRPSASTSKAALNLAISLRQQLSGTEISAQHLLNQLLLDKLLLYQEKVEQVQRLQQLEEIISHDHAADVFCDTEEHLYQSNLQWIQYLQDSQYSSQAHWTFIRSLRSKDSSQGVLQHTQRNKNVVTTIKQETPLQIQNTKGEPVSILALRHKSYSHGYVIIEMMLLDDPQQTLTHGGAGVVFKLKNDKEFGFFTVTQSTSPTNKKYISSQKVLTIGRKNHGTTKIFSTLPVHLDPATWIILAIQFTPSYLRLYINGNPSVFIRLVNPWFDRGTIGLHTAGSSVAFRHILSGPLGSETCCDDFALTAFGKVLKTHRLSTRQWTQEEYQLFLKEPTSNKTAQREQVRHDNLTKTFSPQKGVQCYDYDKASFNLNDWIIPHDAKWILVTHPGSELNRLYHDATERYFRSDHSLLLKNFGCKAASVSIQILLFPQSEGGILIDDSKDASRWMSTLDSAYGVVKLIRVDDTGVPTTLHIVSVPGLHSSELYKLELRKSVKSGVNNYQVWLNEKRLVEHSVNSSIPFEDGDDVPKTRGNDHGGVGLFVGKGSAEISQFRVFNVVQL